MKSILTLVLFGLLGLNSSNSTAVVPNTDIAKTQLHQKSISLHNNKVQIALLLDTSNSMDGLINQAKAQLWDIVNEFTYARCSHRKSPSIEIALYQYGNNELSSREGYIQQVLGFSNDLDEISKKLFSLTTNGGEEYCGEVIHTSIEQLDWNRNPDGLRMIFIAGNEPFTQGRHNYKDAVSQAKEMDIVVNTIFCGDYQQGIQTEWQRGARLTGGEYMAIDHNREIVHVPTPYDEIIIRLNKKLNNTYISYGYEGTARIANQSVQDANAMELEEAVAVKRAVSKSSGYYKNSSWDLVDAAEEEDFEIGKVERKHLPSELQSKSDKELAAHIEAKKAERDQIQEEIRELDAKRQEFLAQNQKDQKGELESAMLNAIKKQASRKNFSWTKK
ncbi:MAG: VWA domain-containing protein [Flavobacteriaceae bacterium]